MNKERKYTVGDYVMLWSKKPARIAELYDEDCEPTSEHWYRIEFAEVDGYRGTVFGEQSESALHVGTEKKFNETRKASVDKAIQWLLNRIEYLHDLCSD